MLIDNEWCNIPNRIKEEAQAFYANRFREPMHSRPNFCCDGIKCLSDIERDSLDGDFSKEEVLKAVKECDGNRAPGRDGFNFNFIKRFWPVLENDFMGLLTQFHKDRVIHKGVSSSFITLIPKVSDPSGLNDFRPISLIGCVSK